MADPRTDEQLGSECSAAPFSLGTNGSDPVESTVSIVRWLVWHRVCARRADACALVRSGTVTVNDVPCVRLGQPILGARDTVAVAGRNVILQEQQHTHYILHKPKHCICTRRSVLHNRKDPGSPHRPDPRDTIYRYIPEAFHHLHAIGRLDYDTTGILLLTTDGSLTHRLATPSFHVPKVYRCRLRDTKTYINGTEQQHVVSTDQRLSDAAIAQLARGIDLPNGRRVAGTAWNVDTTATADSVSDAANTIDATLVDIEIHAGANHQVKHMIGRVGRSIAHLHRRTFAGLELPSDLARPGQGRPLTAAETAHVYAVATSS